MFTDRVIAVCAVAGMLLFLGVFVVWVPHLDLIIVVTAVLLMLIYDFWRALGPGRGKNGPNTSGRHD